MNGFLGVISFQCYDYITGIQTYTRMYHSTCIQFQARNSCSSASFAEDTEKLGFNFGCETYSEKAESLMDLVVWIFWNVYELLRVESGFFASIVDSTSKLLLKLRSGAS